MCIIQTEIGNRTLGRIMQVIHLCLATTTGHSTYACLCICQHRSVISAGEGSSTWLRSSWSVLGRAPSNLAASSLFWVCLTSTLTPMRRYHTTYTEVYLCIVSHFIVNMCSASSLPLHTLRSATVSVGNKLPKACT